MIQIQYLGVTSRSWFYHICMKIIDGSCLHYNRLDRAVLIFSPKAGFDKMKIETIPPNKKKMSDMGTVICTISTGIEETSIEIPVSTHQFEKRHAYVDGNKITIKKLSPTFEMSASGDMKSVNTTLNCLIPIGRGHICVSFKNTISSLMYEICKHKYMAGRF